MSVQTSYSNSPTIGLPGQRYTAGGPERIVPKVPRNEVVPGRFCFDVPGYGGAGSNMIDPGEIYQLPDPVAAADVDAIVASGASSGSLQTISGAGLTGVVGGTKMFPGRTITLVLSSHADWNATTAVLTAKRNGVTYSEDLAIPDAGNATVTSVSEYDEFVSLVIPAQAGTGGTFTVGIAALTAAALAGIAGVVMHVPMHEQDDEGNGLVYADGEPIDVMEEGEVLVEAEEAMVFTDTVYVRVATGAGGTALGKVRNDSDSSTCVAHTGAKVRKYDSATGLVALKLK